MAYAESQSPQPIPHANSGRAPRADILAALRANPFILAPMAGITDHGFRSFMKARGSSVVITELVSAAGIQYESQKTFDLMSFDETQHPIGIQLFGEEPAQVAAAAKIVEERGADFVDLNFGCPVPKVVKKGAGSAMMKEPLLMAEMLRQVVAAVSIPVTIKVRTGWDANMRNALEIAHIAANEGITWMAIHGRSRAQGYTGFADWDFIREVKAGAKLPIIGNGDIVTSGQAVKRLTESGCDGVMIGRGALKNPYIFQDALTQLSGHESVKMPRSGHGIPVPRNYAKLFQELHDCFAAHCPERILQIQLKKFAAWFATGYPGAAQFRKQVFQATSTAQLLDMALSFFASLTIDDQVNPDNEGFLMGGHG